MQETESCRLAVSIRQHPPDKADDRRAIRGLDHCAVGRDALLDLKDVTAAHYRFGLAVAQIVDRVLVVPLQQQHVADALCDEKTDCGSPALEDGIGRHGRAVDEFLDLSRVEAGGIDRMHGPLIGICRRARHFRRAHGLSVNRHQIGERSTNLDTDAHARSRFPTVVLVTPILSLQE